MTPTAVLQRSAAAAAAALILGWGATARADAIDGDWCHAAQNLHIRGPDIRTPGGNQIKGDYDRHGFRYTVPANEPDAGTPVVMILNSEEQMTLTRKSSPVPETWRRCKPIS
jgi:hypothetical protein